MINFPYILKSSTDNKYFAVYIQPFRETLSEKSTQVRAIRPKGSMGRSIELLHVLNTNEI